MPEKVFAIGAAVAVLLVALVVIAVVTTVRKERERRRRIARWAAHHGWHVVLNPTVPWIGLVPGRSGDVGLLVHGRVDGYTVAVTTSS